MNYKKIQKLLLVGLYTFSGMLLASQPAAPMHSGLSLDAVMTAAEERSRRFSGAFLVERANYVASVNSGDVSKVGRVNYVASIIHNTLVWRWETSEKESCLFRLGEYPYLFFYTGNKPGDQDILESAMSELKPDSAGVVKEKDLLNWCEKACLPSCEVLYWCLCRKADIHLRKRYVEQLVGLYESKDVSAAICHVEFGSGGLKQLFITAQGLASRGFKNLQLIGIDTDYEDADDKEYFESAFNFLWQHAPVAATCALKLYASNDEFLANFHTDFPDQLSIDSLSAIDLPVEAYADLKTCIEYGPLSDDTNVVFADKRVVSIAKPEVLSRLTL